MKSCEKKSEKEESQREWLQQLIPETKIEQKDIDSSHGKTRVYWANKELTSPPLVMLHGWGTGSGCFFKNVAHINAPVMLVDLPGFGHSERKDFGTEDPFEIETIWSNSLVEVIQKEVKEDFWLAGHSFGCYLSAKLCMDGVLKPQGLILLDPWGFAVDDGALQKKFDSLPWIRRTTIKTAFSLFKLLKWESGLEVFRAFRKSISMPLIKRARPELRAIYGDEFFEYTFDINSTAPATGEKAFTKIKGSSVYATNPMLPRLSESIDSLPQNTHFIFGADSWLSSEPAEILQQKAKEMTDKNVTVHKVEGASHHLTASHPTEVNDLINRCLSNDIL